MGKKRTIPIICFASGKPGDWEATCLNFDLSVQGDSFEDVQTVLHEMIVDYIESLVDLPKEEQMRFLNRKAPLFLRIKYHLLWLWAVFGHNSRRSLHNYMETYQANGCLA